MNATAPKLAQAPEFIGFNQIAAMLGVPPLAVLRWFQCGLLNMVTLDGQLVVRRDDFETFRRQFEGTGRALPI